MKQFSFVVTVITFALILQWCNGRIETSCDFSNFQAHCHPMIGSKYKTEITITVNHCNNPADVTITVKNQEPSFTWNHTFVNDREIQTIHNYHTDLVQLEVWLSRSIRDDVHELHILAKFYLNSDENPEFVNSYVRTGESTCTPPDSDKMTGTVIAVVVVAVTVGAIIFAIVFICYKRRLHSREVSELMANMETPAISDVFKDGQPCKSAQSDVKSAIEATNVNEAEADGDTIGDFGDGLQRKRKELRDDLIGQVGRQRSDMSQSDSLIVGGDTLEVTNHTIGQPKSNECGNTFEVTVDIEGAVGYSDPRTTSLENAAKQKPHKKGRRRKSHREPMQMFTEITPADQDPDIQDQTFKQQEKTYNAWEYYQRKSAAKRESESQNRESESQTFKPMDPLGALSNNSAQDNSNSDSNSLPDNYTDSGISSMMDPVESLEIERSDKEPILETTVPSYADHGGAVPNHGGAIPKRFVNGPKKYAHGGSRKKDKNRRQNGPRDWKRETNRV